MLNGLQLVLRRSWFNKTTKIVSKKSKARGRERETPWVGISQLVRHGRLRTGNGKTGSVFTGFVYVGHGLDCVDAGLVAANRKIRGCRTVGRTPYNVGIARVEIR
jgi:hypothetical protein